MSQSQSKNDRKYTQEHEWALQEGNEIVIGITGFAVEQLGDITLVGLDVEVGDEIERGQVFGTVESVKTLSDLFAPLSGRVTRINENLEEQPELINSDPWGVGWMLAIEPSAYESEAPELIDAAAYDAYVEASQEE